MGLSDNSTISDGIFSIVRPLSSKAGIGLGYKNLSLDRAYSEETVAAGFGFSPQRSISAGVTLKYLRVKYGTDEYTRIDPVFAARSEKSAFDADAGILVRINETLSAGYVRQNVMGADIGLKDQALLAGADKLGIAYRETSLTLTGEFVRVKGQNRLLSAMEKSFSRDLFILRAGIGWGGADFRKITTGFRVNLNQFAIDYAWDYPLTNIDKTAGSHYLTFVARIGKGNSQAKANVKKLLQKLGTPVTRTQAPAAQTACLAPAVPAAAAPAAPAPSLEKMPELAASIPSIMLKEQVPAQRADLHASALRLLTPEFIGQPLIVSAAPAAVPVAQPLTASTTGAAEPAVMVSTDTAIAASSATVKAAAAEPTAVKPQKVAAPKKPKSVTVKALEPEQPVFVTQSQPQPPQPAYGSSSSGRKHKVAPGETLPMIAEKYYGNRNLWVKIYEANRDQIEKGNISPEKVLIIP
jgi:nucleoid-associated protein YgaU